jgi:N-acylneuraminate cytidylyltransferase
MIENHTTLAIILARGGSKGVPSKNILNVGGKPLIVWTIEEAKKSQYIDRLILSSDSTDIIAVALEYGCESPFVRPPHLALDDTPSMPPLLYTIERLEKKYDYVVLLQPTSPLRSVSDIDGCIAACIEHNVPACISITEAPKSPYWMYQMDSEGRLRSILTASENALSRQQLPAAYVLNGAVYVARTEWLKKEGSFMSPATIGYVMPRERSLDIDTKLDMGICDYLLSKVDQDHDKSSGGIK